MQTYVQNTELAALEEIPRRILALCLAHSRYSGQGTESNLDQQLILRLRKPRPRKCKWLLKVTQVVSDGAGDSTWASSFISPTIYNAVSRCFLSFTAWGERQDCCLLLCLSQNKQWIYFCKSVYLGLSWNLMTNYMHTILETCIQSFNKHLLGVYYILGTDLRVE